MTAYTCDSFRFFNLFLVYFGGKGTGFAQFRFANTGGAQEQETANGPLGVFQADTAAANGTGHRLHSLVLPHDPFVEASTSIYTDGLIMVW